MKFYWVNDEGGWFAWDKFFHLVGHFGVVLLFRIFLWNNPVVAKMISETWGWLYEWLWDCWLYPKFYNKKGGASYKDIVCNNVGGYIAAFIPV